MRKIISTILLLGFIFVSTALAISYSGSLDASDPIKLGRLFRDGIASTCAAPKAYPGTLSLGSQFYYETFTYTNYLSTPVCVEVSNASATTNVHLIAYLGSYDPANPSANYLADIGASIDQPFSFTLGAGQRAIIVAETTIGLVDANFLFSILPDQTAPSGAEAANAPVPLDERINRYDASAPVAVYVNVYGGVDIYRITDGAGTLVLRVTSEDFEKAANAAGNVIAGEFEGILVAKLGGGGYQVNAPAGEGKTYFLFFDELKSDSEYSHYTR